MYDSPSKARPISDRTPLLRASPPGPPGFATVLFALTLIFSATSALAVDGVAEINHTCAVHTGCFAGDLPGYPITIDGQAGGSYRLTSNLIVPDADTDGIKISASSLAIDLNGFEIVLSGCDVNSNSVVGCTPTGEGSGIEGPVLGEGPISGDEGGNVSVRNGSITGMGKHGIDLASKVEITGILVRYSGQSGIRVGAESIVSDNRVVDNGFAGISLGQSAIVQRNIVRGNGNIGIGAGSHSKVSENTVTSNDSHGIAVGSGAMVSENSVNNNGAHGIQTSGGSAVQRNVIRSNGGYGLNLGSQSAYRENLITNNTTGTVFGASAVNIFGNSCNGTTTCP